MGSSATARQRYLHRYRCHPGQERLGKALRVPQEAATEMQPDSMQAAKNQACLGLRVGLCDVDWQWFTSVVYQEDHSARTFSVNQLPMGNISGRISSKYVPQLTQVHNQSRIRRRTERGHKASRVARHLDKPGSKGQKANLRGSLP